MPVPPVVAELGAVALRVLIQSIAERLDRLPQQIADRKAALAVQERDLKAETERVDQMEREQDHARMELAKLRKRIEAMAKGEGLPAEPSKDGKPAEVPA